MSNEILSEEQLRAIPKRLSINHHGTVQDNATLEEVLGAICDKPEHVICPDCGSPIISASIGDKLHPHIRITFGCHNYYERVFQGQFESSWALRKHEYSKQCLFNQIGLSKAKISELSQRLEVSELALTSVANAYAEPCGEHLHVGRRVHDCEQCKGMPGRTKDYWNQFAVNKLKLGKPKVEVKPIKQFKCPKCGQIHTFEREHHGKIMCIKCENVFDFTGNEAESEVNDGE
jgi:ribosomal protein L37AE/L43A